MDYLITASLFAFKSYLITYGTLFQIVSFDQKGF